MIAGLGEVGDHRKGLKMRGFPPKNTEEKIARYPLTPIGNSRNFSGRWTVKSLDSLRTRNPFAFFQRERGVLGFCRFAGNGIKSVERIGHAHVAQLAERVLGKDEVISSTLIMGSI